MGTNNGFCAIILISYKVEVCPCPSPSFYCKIPINSLTLKEPLTTIIHIPPQKLWNGNFLNVWHKRQLKVRFQIFCQELVSCWSSQSLKKVIYLLLKWSLKRCLSFIFKVWITGNYPGFVPSVPTLLILITQNFLWSERESFMGNIIKLKTLFPDHPQIKQFLITPPLVLIAPVKQSLCRREPTLS